MSNALIRQGFESVLATWAAAQAPPIPVAWQNQTFTPPATRYIRAFLLPGQTTSSDMSGEQSTFVGVWQVSVYVPIGTGAGDAQALENAIVALYPKTNVIAVSGFVFRLTRPMSAAPPIPSDTHYIVPISCSYRADI